MKSQIYLLGVDLGTSSTKTALYQIDGTLIATASQEVPIYHPKPGTVEQKNDDFYITAAETVRECIINSGIDPKQVAGIAFDSQMAGVGTVDKDFNSVTRFDSWLDMRCQPYIESLDNDYGDLITRLTGCPPTCDHGPKIMWWKNEHPDVYKKIAKFVMPAGYVVGKMCGLTGEEAFIDHTFLHFTTLADTKNGVWSDELCELTGVDREKLPRIVAPWEKIGEVTEKAAVDFGLAAGTIVAAGCGDTAAGALGSGITQPGQLLDIAGTASVLASCTASFVADVENRALLTMRSVIPGLYHPLGYIAGGGMALRWFRDQFFNTFQGETQPADGELYDKMTKLAEKAAPGSEGLFFSPHLGGRVCPASPQMRGAWVGFTWGHTQAHFTRALLESVAYEYAYYLRILKDMLPDLELIESRVIGGGAKSQTWNQIKADILGVPIQRLIEREFGTWGCAMIAGKAAGIFDDLAETAQRTALPKGAPIETDPKNHAYYQEQLKKYIDWQKRLAEGFRT